MPSQSRNVTLAVSDGSMMNAYVSLPDTAGPHPGILVLQDAMGVNSQLRDIADSYAKLGFVAIAPELFHRTSPGFEASPIVMEVVMPLIRSMTNEGLSADLSAAHDWLISSGGGGVNAEQTAAVGFCMGGRATFLANSVLPLAAAISYYGGGIAAGLLDRASSLHGRHLFFWGGKDSGIPAEQRRAVADALHESGKQFVDVVFSECQHAFFNKLSDRYNAEATRQSWALGVAFLEDALDIRSVNDRT